MKQTLLLFAFVVLGTAGVLTSCKKDDTTTNTTTTGTTATTSTTSTTASTASTATTATTSSTNTTANTSTTSTSSSTASTSSTATTSSTSTTSSTATTSTTSTTSTTGSGSNSIVVDGKTLVPSFVGCSGATEYYSMLAVATDSSASISCIVYLPGTTAPTTGGTYDLVSSPTGLPAGKACILYNTGIPTIGILASSMGGTLSISVNNGKAYATFSGITVKSITPVNPISKTLSGAYGCN